MTSFLNPPSFQTGDVLSASKVNHMLTDIDTLYGWYYGPWYGCDRQQFRTTQAYQYTVEGWAGWLVLTGEILIVQLSNFVNPGGYLRAKVYFDGVLVGQPQGYTSAGVKTINLSAAITANGWQRWTPYRVSVVTEREHSDTGASIDVENVYLKTSTVPSTGILPEFTDGDTSSAADFNAISDGIRTVEPTFAQPIAGCWGGVPYMTQGTNTGWTTVQSWRIQHRLNGIRASLFIQGAPGATISARLLYNSVSVTGALWEVAAGAGPLRITDEINLIQPAAPTVGSFYNVEFQIRQSDGWNDFAVTPLHIYEDQLGLPASYDETLRWEHGYYAIGDGGGTPGLSNLYRNLTLLDNNSTATGVVNVAQREPVDTLEFPKWLSADRRVYHARRWRWLAYKKQPWYTETGDDGLPFALEPSIHWTYDGKTWDSFTLPDLDGEGGYYDLDTSPIAVGMTFYVTGIQYAIQTPRTYE